MNRRGFFKTLAAATAGFTILPPATTYQRIWKATPTVKWGPIHYPIPFDPRLYRGQWQFIIDSSPLWLSPVKAGVFPTIIRTDEELLALCQKH